MITSKENEKLKLVRRLRDPKHRRAEGLFATEGEDLLAAGLAAGSEPLFVLRAPGAGVDGEDVARELLDSVSALGSGTRAIAVWPVPPRRRPGRRPTCVYLHAVADPGNVGAIVRTTHALADATVALGPGCADPYSPKALRASMGSIFSVPLARCEVGATPRPRVAMVAHGGERPSGGAGATVCLGAEREGLPDDVLAACELRWTVPLRAGAESLNVAAAAAIALERLSSAAAEQGER